MSKGYVLYNPQAGNGTCAEAAAGLEVLLEGETELVDMTALDDYQTFFDGLEPEDTIVLCGGDGTLNRFINDTDGRLPGNEILYFPCGSGNDFAHDLGHKSGDMPFPIREYLQDLPTVTVKGRAHRFLNGVGYGIDGYCCEEGDIQREKSDKPVNYTAIAIKGLLFGYKPTGARVTVDGVTHTYRKVWIAPTMNGRFYGGGMIPTPEQKRLGEEKKLSLMVFHDSGKLKTLMIFPSIFKGEHVKNTKYVEVLTGREITVEFDAPRPLQIDGETILDVTGYHAAAKTLVTV